MDITPLIIAERGWIYRTARKYFKDRHDAEDLAGETICKCLSQAHRYDCRRGFRPWVKAVMTNTYITFYNHRQCVDFAPYDATDEEIYFAPERSDQQAAFNSIVSVLRDCRRRSCSIESVLLYAVGYSYEEIADAEHIPVGTVKSRVAAGRRMLREALSR